MAGFTRVNGASAPFQAVGRTLFFKTFAKASMTTAMLDDIVREVQQTATITAIGAFTSGSSNSVNMIVEGTTIANQSAAAFGNVAGVTVTDMAF